MSDTDRIIADRVLYRDGQPKALSFGGTGRWNLCGVVLFTTGTGTGRTTITIGTGTIGVTTFYVLGDLPVDC
jgi:hypothetical protein